MHLAWDSAWVHVLTCDKETVHWCVKSIIKNHFKQSLGGKSNVTPEDTKVATTAVIYPAAPFDFHSSTWEIPSFEFRLKWWSVVFHPNWCWVVMHWRVSSIFCLLKGREPPWNTEVQSVFEYKMVILENESQFALWHFGVRHWNFETYLHVCVVGIAGGCVILTR